MMLTVAHFWATSVESLWKGATNHEESLRTTVLVQPVLCQSFLNLRLSAITVFDAIS